MKSSLACPKCESRKLWRIERIRNESDAIGGRELPVALWTESGKGWASGTEERLAGRYDAYVCHQCGYTEFWAHSFGDLTHQPDKGIHFVDTTPQQGQYR